MLFELTREIFSTHNIDYETESIESAVFSQNVLRDADFLKSERAIKRILNQSDGILCSFDEALPQLMHIDQKTRNRRALNFDFEFGTQLTIKVSAYIYVGCPLGMTKSNQMMFS